MHLRLATPADIPAVMQVIRAVVPLMRSAGNLQWDDDYPNPEAFARDIARTQLWVAELGPRIAGMAALTTDQEPEYADVGWDITAPALVVHRLAVHPQLQGLGVARALLQQAEQVAAQLGLPELRIDTNTQNPVIQRLLPKLGYRLVGEIDLAFRPGLRFYCYEKILAQYPA